MRALGWISCAFLVSAVGCSEPAGHTTDETPIVAERCLVRIHGKGGSGAEPRVADGRAILSPTGNAAGWNGRQWVYFPDERYREALAIVQAAVAGCEQIILNGFSNGGAFVAKLACSGEHFGRRLRGVVIDDPVTDASTQGCAPATGVGVTLYWTGALERQAPPGADCSSIDWTCEGGRTFGIDVYAAGLGATAKRSPHSTHEWFSAAPELSDWAIRSD